MSETSASGTTSAVLLRRVWSACTNTRPRDRETTASTSACAVCRDLLCVHLDQTLLNRKPDAQPAFISFDCAVALIEKPEHLGQQRRRDAPATIFYQDQNVRALRKGASSM